MGLAAMAAAAAVVQEMQMRESGGKRKRGGCVGADESSTDAEAFESDSSGSASGASVVVKKLRLGPAEAAGKKKKEVAPVVIAAEPVMAREDAEMDPDAFPAAALLDLAGSTSAQVRRMNEDERALVHYKRRLRNRESAKRSRARRQATINDIQVELEDLRQVTASLVDRCVSYSRANERQNQELETLRKEKALLESMLRSGSQNES